MISFKGIPDCKYPISKEIMDKIYYYDDSMSVEDILLGWINSDCGSIVTKYKYHPELVVEFNSFYLEENETYSDYQWSLNKIVGNKNINYIINNPKDYLDKIDYCYVYSGDESAMVLSKSNNGWTRKYFASEKLQKEIDHQ